MEFRDEDGQEVVQKGKTSASDVELRIATMLTPDVVQGGNSGTGRTRICF